MLSELVFENGICRFKNFPARHFFTTMQAGNMSSRFGNEEEVLSNFAKYLNRFGLSTAKSAVVLPEHSDKIIWFTDGCAGGSTEIHCDGLISAQTISLILRPADCFPVLMTTADQKFVGLFHAGWRGTDLEITQQALELAAKVYRVRADDILIGIGPGIHKCCYDNERVAERLSADERWRPFISKGSLGKRIDLLDFNVKQLLEAGIRPEHITVASSCTFCAKDKNGNYLFFSHRRALRTGEKEGRFAAVISTL